MFTELRLIGTSSAGVTIERKCPFCGTAHTAQYDREGFTKWQRGELVQRALPKSTSSERELLMTGICDDCFPKKED